MRRTKIVCTLGPAVDSRDAVRQLISAGMNVARLNCSHGDWETRKKWIGWVRDLSPTLAPVAILADLQGPKFRLGEIAGGQIELRPGQVIVAGPEKGADIPVRLDLLSCDLSGRCSLLLGDGNVELRLGRPSGRNFEAKVVSGGVVRSRQGVTVPGRVYSGEVITQKDRVDIAQATKMGVDYVALSYVRSGKDLKDLRSLLPRDSAIGVCAKIETREALRDLEDVIAESDMLMVARGDLGLQMALEKVPLAQKRIIEHCNRAGKPVITATQMLESMINSPRPTRAEATDVANAILDGTDAVMLSAETAAGHYPMKAAQMLAKIAAEADDHLDRRRIELDYRERARRPISHTEAVAHAAAELAGIIKPAAIVTTTTSGQTARLVSKFRPAVPILCAAWSQKVQAKMSAVWGVQALQVALPKSTDNAVDTAISAFVKSRCLKRGDTVVVTAGVPAGTPGNTNMILVRQV